MITGVKPIQQEPGEGEIDSHPESSKFDKILRWREHVSWSFKGSEIMIGKDNCRVFLVESKPAPARIPKEASAGLRKDWE